MRDFEREGEISCFLVYSDRKHVEYINNILNPIREFLDQNGFKVRLLSEVTPGEEHYGQVFEDIVEQCALGVIILDGFRPNVIYEYGYLRGKNKPIIAIQDKNACIAIKSIIKSNETIINNKKKYCGLTKKMVDDLKEPPIGFFTQLSDRAGVKVIVVDRNASLGSSDHLKNILKKEIKLLMPKIIEEWENIILKPISNNTKPEILHRVRDNTHKILEYYSGIKNFTIEEVKSISQELENLEKEATIEVPPQLYDMIGFLYYNN